MFLQPLRRFPFFRLLLALAIAGLWVRSHTKSDIFCLFVNRGQAELLASDRGRVILCLTNIPFGPQRTFTYDFKATTNEEFDPIRTILYTTIPLPEKTAGMWLGGSGVDPFGLPGAKYRYVIVPMWIFAAAAGLMLVRGVQVFWRRRRWGSPGTCGGCGYDTRFSTGRCPECGAEMPAETVKAAV